MTRSKVYCFTEAERAEIEEYFGTIIEYKRYLYKFAEHFGYVPSNVVLAMYRGVRKVTDGLVVAFRTLSDVVYDLGQRIGSWCKEHFVFLEPDDIIYEYTDELWTKTVYIKSTYRFDYFDKHIKPFARDVVIRYRRCCRR